MIVPDLDFDHGIKLEACDSALVHRILAAVEVKDSSGDHLTTFLSSNWTLERLGSVIDVDKEDQGLIRPTAGALFFEINSQYLVQISDFA